MDFSHHESPNPAESRSDEGGILRRVVRNPSHKENHTKCIFSHTYTLNLRHFIVFNQAKYNVHSCRSWKPCEMDLSQQFYNILRTHHSHPLILLSWFMIIETSDVLQWLKHDRTRSITTITRMTLLCCSCNVHWLILIIHS